MIVLLDAYSLGDPLFASAFARDVQARGGGLVAVHGSGEAGERALEGMGAWPQMEHGTWRVTTDAQRAAIERAARDLNRRLVHEINEAGAPVIGAIGAGRGLLRAETTGDVEAGATGWIATLVGQGASVVVAALVADDAGQPAAGPLGTTMREVDPAAAAAALARAMDVAVAVLMTGRAARLDGPSGPVATLPLEAAVASGRLADADAVARVASRGVPVLAVTAAALRTSGKPEGTWIVGASGGGA